MPDTSPRELDLGFAYSAGITTEVSGEGNSLRTRVTANVSGPSTRRFRVEWAADSLVIETEGSWEATSMAALLRGVADALQGQ